ncbi:MAG: MerR family transcriptional regulator [Candidatus Limnocylindrales bacterium]
MNVSELARRAGVEPSAVRYYESAGILPRPARSSNGYRRYEERDLSRLRLLVALRRVGLVPSQAGRIASLCIDGDGSDSELSPLLAEQRAGIALRRAALDSLEAELRDLESTISAADRVRVDRKEYPVSHRPIRVLFVCTGNAARSQMAEALLREYGGSDFEAFSAGTEPRGVHPFTVRVLAETGIDWSAARSKSVNEFLEERFDYVITVCDRARQVCPVFPGDHNSLHWGLEDPAAVEGTDAERLAAFRQTQVELANRIRAFVELARRARPATAR